MRSGGSENMGNVLNSGHVNSILSFHFTSLVSISFSLSSGGM